MEKKTVKSKKGTANKGSHYEYLIAALVSLKLLFNKNIRHFKMDNNIDDMGAFDDLVLTIVKKDESEENYALQLKHKEKGGHFQFKSFEAKGGEFTLSKYYEHYKSYLRNTTHQLIFYTNWKLHHTKLDNQQFEEFQLFVDDNCSWGYLFDTSDDIKSIFCFNSLVDEKKDFFSRLFLFASQMSMSQCYEQIQLLLEKEFNIHGEFAKRIATDYRELFKNWHLQEIDLVTLTRDTLLQFLLETIIKNNLKISYQLKEKNEICKRKVDLIRQVISKFDVTIVSTEDAEILDFDFLSAIYSSLQKCEDKQEIIKEAKKLLLMIKKETIDSVDTFNELRIKVEAYLGELPLLIMVDDKIKNALAKLLSIFKTEKCAKLILQGNLLDSLPNNLKYWQNLQDLQQIDDQLYNEVVSTFTIKIRSHTITLQQLFSIYPELTKSFKTNHILKLLKYSELIPITDLPENYIPRFLEIKAFNYDVIIKISGLILIEYGEFRNDILRFLQKHRKLYHENLVDFRKNPQISIVIIESFIDSNCVDDESCHKFRVVGDNELECVRTYGDELLRENFRYIKVKDEKVVDFISRNPMNIICDIPGMGKTTFGRYLYNDWDWKNFLIFVDCRNVLMFEQLLESNNKLLHNFIKNCEESKNIVFIWDNLDQLSKQDLEKILSMIKKSRKKRYKQLILTRLNLEEFLENTFKIIAMKIGKVEKDQQYDYLKSQLQNQVRVDELYNRFSRKDFLGVPLHLHMLSKIMDNKDLKNLGIITILYKNFIEWKFQQSVDEKFNNTFFLKYEKLAVISLFKKNLNSTLCDNILEFLHEEYELFRNDFQKFGDCCGLIIDQDSSNYFIFSHDTFCEYLAACWMVRNLKLLKDFKTFFFDQKFDVVREFFDLILSENLPAHLDALINKIPLNVDKNHELMSEDAAGRSIAHLLCSRGVRHKINPSICRFDNNKIAITIFDYTHITSHYLKKDREIGEFLSKFMMKPDKIFNFTPIDYADATYSWAIIEGLLKNLNIKELKNYKFYQNYEMLLYYILQQNYINFSKLFGNYIKNSILEIGLPIISNDIIEIANFFKSYQVKNYIKSLGFSEIDASIFEEFKNQNQHHRKNELIRTFENLNKTINDPNIIINSLKSFENLEDFKEICLVLSIQNDNLDLFKYYFEICNYPHIDLLRWSLHWNRSTITKYLLKNKIFSLILVNYPLIISSIYDNLEIIQFIINESICDIFLTDQNGYTVLHSTAMYGSIKTLQYLLTYFDKNLKTTQDQNLLMIATLGNKNLETFKYLVDSQYWDINAKDNLGRTALYYAVTHGDLDKIKYLIKNGADYTIKYEGSRSILMLAALSNLQSTKFFIEDCKFDVNETDSKNYTALHYAVQKDSLDIVRYLIEKGADINLRANLGLTALLLACKNNLNIVKFLIEEQHADLTAVEDLGSNALHCAIRYNNSTEMIEYLLEKGVDINSKNFVGQDVITLASCNDNLNILKYLIEEQNYNNVNMVDKCGITPLLYALSNNKSLEIVQYLIEKGADVNAKSPAGQTALMLASLYSLNIVQYLVENHNVDINAVDRNNKNALHYANLSKQKDIEKYLLLKNSSLI